MTDTRDRILGASAELFRRQGYTGTGVKQIVETAGAPFASLYHFFPGGKAELGAETIRHSGAIYERLIDAFFDPADLVGSTERFFAGAAATVRDTDYADACPIATVALEVASTNETLREATADVFESWLATAAVAFVDGGVGEPLARALAIQCLALLEGAFILARATRDESHVLVAGEAAAALVREALAS